MISSRMFAGERAWTSSEKKERLSNGLTNEAKERRKIKEIASINRDLGDWKPELNNARLLLFFFLWGREIERRKKRERLIYKW